MNDKGRLLAKLPFFTSQLNIRYLYTRALCRAENHPCYCVYYMIQLKILPKVGKVNPLTWFHTPRGLGRVFINFIPCGFFDNTEEMANISHDVGNWEIHLSQHVNQGTIDLYGNTDLRNRCAYSAGLIALPLARTLYSLKITIDVICYCSSTLGWHETTGTKHSSQTGCNCANKGRCAQI